jgi:hypothetical protein
MDTPPSPFSPDDWLRLRDALRYVGRDLHHRSFAVADHRRELLWAEMDRCLALADRIEATYLAHGLRDPLPGADGEPG